MQGKMSYGMAVFCQQCGHTRNCFSASLSVSGKEASRLSMFFYHLMFVILLYCKFGILRYCEVSEYTFFLYN